MHIWEKLSGFLVLQGSYQYLDEEPKEFDGKFVENRGLVKMLRNDVYYHIVGRPVWMEEKIVKIWGFSKPISW